MSINDGSDIYSQFSRQCRVRFISFRQHAYSRRLWFVVIVSRFRCEAEDCVEVCTVVLRHQALYQDCNLGQLSRVLVHHDIGGNYRIKLHEDHVRLVQLRAGVLGSHHCFGDFFSKIHHVLN